MQNSNAYGIISWDGESIQELKLEYIPQTIPVDTGEVVVTSGYSNQFPPNIPIGEVVRIEPQKGKETQNIYLKPYVNLYEVAEGFVVKFTPDTTIEQLNESYKNLFE